jgi:transcriptional regulator
MSTRDETAQPFTPEMKKGSMELLILALLDGRDRHGYEIGKLIEQRSGGRLVFRISSLYPTLCRLEDRGWIAGRWVEAPGERRRRFYTLTRGGRRALADQRQRWLQYVAAVRDVVEAPGH